MLLSNDKRSSHTKQGQTRGETKARRGGAETPQRRQGQRKNRAARSEDEITTEDQRYHKCNKGNNEGVSHRKQGYKRVRQDSRPTKGSERGLRVQRASCPEHGYNKRGNKRGRVTGTRQSLSPNGNMYACACSKLETCSMMSSQTPPICDRSVTAPSQSPVPEASNGRNLFKGSQERPQNSQLPSSGRQNCVTHLADRNFGWKGNFSRVDKNDQKTQMRAASGRGPKYRRTLNCPGSP